MGHSLLIAKETRERSRLSNNPIASVFSSHPGRVAGSFAELESDGIPQQGLPVVVALIEQVTGDCRASSDSFVCVGLFASVQTAKEIFDMILTAVEANLGILQKHFLCFIEFSVELLSPPFASQVAGDQLAFVMDSELAS